MSDQSKKIVLEGWHIWTSILLGGILWILIGLFAPVIEPEQTSRSFLIFGGSGLIIIAITVFLVFQRLGRQS